MKHSWGDGTTYWEDWQMTEADKPSSEGCHAGRDGDCTWKHCPQLRDGEPEKSGRHCPLDIDEDEE